MFITNVVKACINSDEISLNFLMLQTDIDRTPYNSCNSTEAVSGGLRKQNWDIGEVGINRAVYESATHKIEWAISGQRRQNGSILLRKEGHM